MYKLSEEKNSVVKDGMLAIPFNPDNADYQAYLKWLAEGNQPLPADAPQSQE